MKDETRRLRGKLSLVPGSAPAVEVRPWPIRMVIRRLLLHARESGGRFQIRSGGNPRRAWLKILLPRPHGAESKEFAVFRQIARRHGGRLQVRGRFLQLSFPAA